MPTRQSPPEIKHRSEYLEVYACPPLEICQPAQSERGQLSWKFPVDVLRDMI